MSDEKKDEKVSLAVRGAEPEVLEGELVDALPPPKPFVGCGECPACLARKARGEPVVVIGSPGRGGLLELLIALAGGAPGMRVEVVTVGARRPPIDIPVDYAEVGQAVHRALEENVMLEHKTAPARHAADYEQLRARGRPQFIPSFLGMFTRMFDEDDLPPREAAVKLPSGEPELPTSKKNVKGPNLSKREMLSRQRQHGGGKRGR